MEFNLEEHCSVGTASFHRKIRFDAFSLKQGFWETTQLANVVREPDRQHFSVGANRARSGETNLEFSPIRLLIPETDHT